MTHPSLPAAPEPLDSSAAMDLSPDRCLEPTDTAETSPETPPTYVSDTETFPAGTTAAEASAADESGPAFYSAAEIARLAPKDVRWIAKPWIAQGALTILDGKPKAAGKTTFLSHMVKKILRGEPFLERETTRTPVVVLSEERPVTFRCILERAGLLESRDLHVLFRDEVHGRPWDEVVKLARARCDELGARLLVVDTLAAFAGNFERSAAASRAALDPLYHAARSGLGVLAVRHERKAGGTVGDSGLGVTVRRWTSGDADRPG